MKKYSLVKSYLVLTLLYPAMPLFAYWDDASILDSMEDVASFQLRGDGRYDVICTNGSYEVVTKDEILSNKICRGTAPVQFKILSVQKRPDGKFNVLCWDHTSQIATADEIRTGKACSNPPVNFGYSQVPTGSASFSPGWLSGFKIHIPRKGLLTHLGFFLAGDTSVQLQLGFYADKNGFPTNAVAFTGLVTGIVGKNEFALSSPANVESGDYWIFWSFQSNATVGTLPGKGLRKAISFGGGNLPDKLDGLDFINAEDSFFWCFYSVVRLFSSPLTP